MERRKMEPAATEREKMKSADTQRETMEERKIVEEAPGVWRVDLRWMGLPRQIASYLLADGDALAVIETGPASTLDAVLDGIRQLGRAPEDVTHALVTHIHLDHS